jgi:hypothetical protein
VDSQGCRDWVVRFVRFGGWGYQDEAKAPATMGTDPWVVGYQDKPLTSASDVL